MSEEWRVYLRRDGKTERTLTVQYIGGCLELSHPLKSAHGPYRKDVYDYTDIMPDTHELFADYKTTVDW